MDILKSIKQGSVLLRMSKFKVEKQPCLIREIAQVILVFKIDNNS